MQLFTATFAGAACEGRAQSCLGGHEAAAATKRMRLRIVLDLCMALLSGFLYSFALEAKDNVLPGVKIKLPKFPLCKLLCSAKHVHIKVVPCFVLPVAGCSLVKK